MLKNSINAFYKAFGLNPTCDLVGLDKLPENSSKTRKHNRCAISGRSHGYIRQFGLSRQMFRQLALFGKIPGLTKSSW